MAVQVGLGAGDHGAHAAVGEKLEHERVLHRAVEDARKQGRKGAVLTCKQRLVDYYAKFCFVDEGVTDKSVHGGVVWHQMRITF